MYYRNYSSLFDYFISDSVAINHEQTTKEGDIILKGAVPGLAKEDINISIKGKKLIVSLPKSELWDKINQEIMFDYELTEKQVSATYEAGVLRITVKPPSGYETKIRVS